MPRHDEGERGRPNAGSRRTVRVRGTGSAGRERASPDEEGVQTPLHAHVRCREGELGVRRHRGRPDDHARIAARLRRVTERICKLRLAVRRSERAAQSEQGEHAKRGAHPSHEVMPCGGGTGHSVASVTWLDHWPDTISLLVGSLRER